MIKSFFTPLEAGVNKNVRGVGKADGVEVLAEWGVRGEILTFIG